MHSPSPFNWGVIHDFGLALRRQNLVQYLLWHFIQNFLHCLFSWYHVIILIYVWVNFIPYTPHFLELNGVLQGFKRWKRKIEEKVRNYFENVHFKSHIYSLYPSWFFLLLMLLHKPYLILKALLGVFIKFFIIFFFLHDHHEKFHNCCLFQCSHQQPLQENHGLSC